MRITKAVGLCESSGSDKVKHLQGKKENRYDKHWNELQTKDNQKFRFLPLLITLKHNGSKTIKLSIQQNKGTTVVRLEKVVMKVATDRSR